MSALARRIAGWRPLIEDELRAIVGDGPAGLYAWMRYHLGWEDERGRPADGSPGKLLRPVALLLAAEAHGGGAAQAAPAAAAVQLVHDFSLLHDDIEDRSDRRRGRPALWTFAGVAQAINTGDGIYTLSRLALQRLRARGVPDARVLDAIAELDAACLRLVEGQHLDLAFEGRADVDRGGYLGMIEGKTAALLAASFAAGGLLAGAPAAAVAALRDFGRSVGVAFQAADDVLGIWGDPAATGKPAGDDLRSRKMTLPVIAALESGAAPALAAAWRGARDAPVDIAALAAEVEAAGGRAAAERLAARELEAAAAALARLPIGADDRAAFGEFARLAAVRAA